MTAAPAQRAFWRERWWWLAVAAGPLCWMALSGLGLADWSSIPGWKTLLMVVLLSPLLEEIVFRGGIQELLLSQRFGRLSRAGFSVANLLTSLGFALLHLLSQPPLWAALILFPSLVFGWCYERSGRRLLPPVVLHMFYNAGFALGFVNVSA